jgi:hypothetical protein
MAFDIRVSKTDFSVCLHVRFASHGDRIAALR